MSPMSNTMQNHIDLFSDVEFANLIHCFNSPPIKQYSYLKKFVEKCKRLFSADYDEKQDKRTVTPTSSAFSTSDFQ